MCVALMSLPEDQGEHGDEFQVFALEHEQINPLDHIMLNDDELAISQKAAEQDPVIQAFEECDSLWMDREACLCSHLHQRLLEHQG